MQRLYNRHRKSLIKDDLSLFTVSAKKLMITGLFLVSFHFTMLVAEMCSAREEKTALKEKLSVIQFYVQRNALFDNLNMNEIRKLFDV